MKRVLFLVFLFVGLLTVMVFAFGTHKTGVVKITVNCDTLNDTVSGSGLAEYTGIVYGLNFVDYANILCRVILEPSYNTVHGYGDADSAILWLQQDKFNELVSADSVICGALPCTLTVDSEAVNWGSALAVKVYLNDTTSDTVMTAEHNVKYEFIVRE